MQVGEDRALGFEPLDPAECVGQREMAWVRPIAQRIDHPGIEPGQRGSAFGRQAAQVAAIGERAEAKTERRNVAVLLEDRQRLDGAARPRNDDWLRGGQPVRLEDRRIVAARRRLETIGKAGLHHRAGLLVQINIDELPLLDEKGAQVIDAVGVVGVLMGVKDSVQAIDPRIEQLLAQSRAACRSARG